MSREQVLNFDQGKRFPENYKPVRVCLYLVSKIVVYNFPPLSISLDEISILTWNLHVNIFCD